MFYKRVIRPLLFRGDPESVHELTFDLMIAAQTIGVDRLSAALLSVSDPALTFDLCGLHFRSPIGLAAGFDKDCRALPFLASLGFGMIEGGTVTPEPQPGNDRPRIIRLASDEALINRVGFPSDGALAVAPRLARFAARKRRPVIGINIGKNKQTPIDEAARDYCAGVEKLQPFADLIVINISSPNTPELRKLQEPERLRALIDSVQRVNLQQKPIFVKIADLSPPEIDGILEICRTCKLSGIIASNTTFAREGLKTATTEQGGMSGRPLAARAKEMVGYIYRKTQGELPIIGVGGIFSAADAIAMMRAGASVVQIYTGMIYEGPSIVRKIQRGIIAHLREHRLQNVAQLVGRDHAG